MIETYVQQLQISNLIFMKFLYMLYIKFNFHSGNVNKTTLYMERYCLSVRFRIGASLPFIKCEPLIFQRFFIISFLADSGAYIMLVSLFVFLLPFSVVRSITQEFDSCNISSNLIGAALPFMGNLKRK